MTPKPILNCLAALTLLAFSTAAFSQKPPEKFGNVSADLFSSNVCPIDSNAHAWFLFDYGNSWFQYADTDIRSNDATNRKGFQLYFTRHFRIKIAGNEGFSWADITVPLYRDTDKEQITTIKAQTYNFENGKVNVTKLDRKDIFQEETSQNWITTKFAMPDIREGSVIEVEYTIKSDFFFNLRPWYFQKSIPVLKSEYHVAIPEYYNFNQTHKGFIPFQRNSEIKPRELKLNYHERSEGLVTRKETYTNSFRYNENVHHYNAINVPAFPDEEYLRTADNYLTKIDFELQSTKFPNTAPVMYTTDWGTINKNLLNSSSFGKELGKTGHLKDDVALLKQMYSDEKTLLTGAFDLVKSKMTWSGSRNKYVSSSLSKAWKDGSGNCADINLNLVNMLGELGFKTWPVILSTQDNGIIHPANPSVSSFNYVIAMAVYGGDTILMDATDRHSEINLLPVRCLNDKGRIVNETSGRWIYLMDYKPWIINENYFVTLNENLNVSGKYQSLLRDYAKYHFKNDFSKNNGQDGYRQDLETKTQCSIMNMHVDGLDTLKEAVKVTFDLTKEDLVERANDLVFFKPAFRPYISRNPFKLEERYFPVEYNYPCDVKQIYTFILPEKCTILELPKPLNVRTPDGAMKYLYNVSQMGNTVHVSVAFSLSRTLFLPEEYEILKNIYQMIVDKQNETIVMKVEG
jgi:hypothetical protein